MATYKKLSELWPDPMPVPTPREAVAGTRRLIRRAFALAAEDGKVGLMGYGPYIKRTRFKITSGNRFTYPRNRTWYVNPNDPHHGGGGGWGEIVHAVSHWAQRRWWPNEDPHAPRHVYIEKRSWRSTPSRTSSPVNSPGPRSRSPMPRWCGRRVSRLGSRLGRQSASGRTPRSKSCGGRPGTTGSPKMIVSGQRKVIVNQCRRLGLPRSAAFAMSGGRW